MFNIGAVSKMTNILEATLRVWERRYGFPNATRTTGGHRLYSLEDVLRLQWVKVRVDEGMQVSHAIRSLQRAEQEGAFTPTAGASSALMARMVAPDAPSLASFHQRLLDALKQHHIDEADRVIGEAQIIYPLESLILDVIGPTLHDVGIEWEQGRLDVATEHLATNHLRNVLLTWMRVGPPAYAINPVVLACAPGELHEGSLLMLGALLRRLRWPVLYLGQTVPLADLAGFLEEQNSSILLFVAMMEASAKALVEWPRWLSEASAGETTLVCYGGRAYLEHPDLIAETPGEYLGDTLQAGIQKLDELLHQRNPLLR
jgi:DNA-binding transcriptional MerR regulator